MHDPRPQRDSNAWLQLGFRPFFAGAGVFSILAIGIWMALYTFNQPLLPAPLPPVTWHAHEMIYGYAMAVIAGFLLTAIQNWTGVRTLHGLPLLLLFALWALSRALYFVPGTPIGVLAAGDLLFNGSLLVAALIPVLKARQWAQLAVVSKLLLLLLGNLVFYLGILSVYPDGVRLGLYAGLYLVLSLILMIGRRVIPFFIERGVGYPFSARNRRWLDLTSLVLFLLFALADLFTDKAWIVALLAAVLFFLHGARLFGWYTPGIWSRPLLWVLILAYGSIILGFGLKAASLLPGISALLAVHAFAAGGIGLMTLGMMARVTLGHTGRNVFEPPAMVGWMLGALAGAACVRVIFPLFFPAPYAVWIGLSQVLWILAFALFAWVYVPMLFTARVDGKPG